MQIKPEHKSGLSPEELDQIRKVFASYPRLKKAILFGSRAMGTYHPGSDIDIAIDGDNLTIQDQLLVMGTLDDKNLPYLIDIVLLKRVENEDLLSHIRRVGQTIYSS